MVQGVFFLRFRQSRHDTQYPMGEGKHPRPSTPKVKGEVLYEVKYYYQNQISPYRHFNPLFYHQRGRKQKKTLASVYSLSEKEGIGVED